MWKGEKRVVEGKKWKKKGGIMKGKKKGIGESRDLTKEGLGSEVKKAYKMLCETKTLQTQCPMLSIYIYSSKP